MSTTASKLTNGLVRAGRVKTRPARFHSNESLESNGRFFSAQGQRMKVGALLTIAWGREGTLLHE